MNIDQSIIDKFNKKLFAKIITQLHLDYITKGTISVENKRYYGFSGMELIDDIEQWN